MTIKTYYGRPAPAAPAARISDRMLEAELQRRAADAIRARVPTMMHAIIADSENASPEWTLAQARIMARAIARIESAPRRIMAMMTQLED